MRGPSLFGSRSPLIRRFKLGRPDICCTLVLWVLYVNERLLCRKPDKMMMAVTFGHEKAFGVDFGDLGTFFGPPAVMRAARVLKASKMPTPERKEPSSSSND